MVTFLRTVLGVAFRVDTWQRVAYGLLALPIGLLGLVSAGPAHWLGRRLGLPGYADAPEPRPGGRVLGFGLLAVPLNLAAFALTAYTLFGLVLNLAYPIRVEGFPGVLAHPLSPFEGSEGAWGGPTLAGAWAVHGIGGYLVFGVIGLWMIRGLTLLCGRTTLCATGNRTGSSRSLAGSASSSR